MAYLGRGLDKISNIEVLDNITFDGSSSYSITKGSVAFTPNSAQSCLISIDGVVQATNFTVSSSTIDFGVAIPSTSVCNFFLHYGTGVMTVPSDGSVTEAKIGSNAVTTNKLAYNPNPHRNIIINGDMSIAQRGTSTASVSSGATFPALDRFKFYVVSGGTWTVSQDTDVPSGQGFAKSLKMDNTTANGSLSSGSLAQIQQGIEGQNLQYLKKGTSNAESVTLSFWVKSNKTGTYICEIRDTDNSRSISKSYTVSSASTWEKKTITFDGDTTGTLNNDNDKSFELIWWLLGGTDFTSGTLQTSWGSQTNANRAVGQVNLADSTANEWYVTGVQLEAGTTASDFEFLPVDVNLARCLRYYYSDDCDLDITIRRVSDSSRGVHKTLPVPMRTAPTFTAVSSVEIGNTSMSDSSDKSVRFTMSGNADNNPRYTEYNFSAEL